MVDYLIGVDGGGSGTRALIHRLHGEVVGTGQAGPSALQQGIPQAWDNVLLAIRRGFEAAGLAVPPGERCALAAGLSGVSHGPWRDAFLARDPGFAALEVRNRLLHHADGRPRRAARRDPDRRHRQHRRSAPRRRHPRYSRRMGIPRG